MAKNVLNYRFDHYTVLHYNKRRHSGYMTEAVQVMCKWALKQENVTHIIAETDVDGFASQCILQRSGFVEIKRAETIWWRL
ncbi:GNAT family N-acetyltransferase [Extibacter sp. GGCC_0201]|uniref:GNAT family N-acetyltransferase n=1 Tax=Extibacter sp. GGCC_0201 TaxID=2731209 RepID=UPI001AA0BB0D|nr:GNAT family N-acetyltransferase [Extibacter sp. GGCC_0201]MBO1719365.1 GNAT family N-acetyltransferase [Extibacter sp. GGCC_0201]